MTTLRDVPGKFPDQTPEDKNVKVIRTTDSPNCTGACGWLATVKDGKIIDVKQAADYDNPEYNPRGCLRGASMTHTIYSSDRVKTPLISTGMRGEGKFKEATWDEALDHIAEKFRKIIKDYGPESLLLFNQVVGTSYVQKGAQVRLFSLLGGSFSTAYDFNGDIAMG
ncbi:MAG: molybdopterin-dependent oxidoreductase, partial [Candidatus Margulisiibacteriota bacterium]